MIELGICNMIVNPANVPTADKGKSQKEDVRDSIKPINSHIIISYNGWRQYTDYQMFCVEVEGLVVSVRLIHFI